MYLILSLFADINHTHHITDFTDYVVHPTIIYDFVFVSSLRTMPSDRKFTTGTLIILQVHDLRNGKYRLRLHMTNMAKHMTFNDRDINDEIKKVCILYMCGIPYINCKIFCMQII